VVLAKTGLLKMEHLPAHFGEAGFAPSHNAHLAASVPDTGNVVRVEVGTTVDEAEKQLILRTLASTSNNKTRAAEILGISSKTLQNKLKEYAADASQED